MKENVIRIIDDDPAIHDSLSLIFEIQSMPVRHYYSAEEFLAADFMSDPGCAIVDLRMSGITGLELQQRMKMRNCQLPLIFLSGHGDIETAVSAMEEGAVTFLTKPVTAKKLIQAVERAFSSQSVGEAGTSKLKEQLKLLSERELEILELLKQRLTCRTIAERLNISLRTAEVHRTSIMRKLHCASVQELTVRLDEMND